ncbi:MAG: hypothetical protein ETSY1_36980 [Candidatus Entotheonella factor]|uniref:Uncharacterized protein n=1 Tax=Entotheonella factor TaxID=1429438 RepID=W4L8D2_ENTF1|nr:MAG: hypothetical protein ETSY1_36980 [Candidatus Entotheonella factor]
MWNLGTCRLDVKGAVQVEDPQGPEYRLFNRGMLDRPEDGQQLGMMIAPIVLYPGTKMIQSICTIQGELIVPATTLLDIPDSEQAQMLKALTPRPIWLSASSPRAAVVCQHQVHETSPHKCTNLV